jgi:hypothetical protein
MLIHFIQVANAPPGTQAATMDVEGAYRTIPIKPDHKRYIVLRFHDEYYIDHDTPFGAGSAHGLQGEVGDATVDIFYSLRIHPVIKWVDDFNVFRFPSTTGSYISEEFPDLRYEYDLSLIKFLTEPLRIPWHRDKGQDFGSQFPYLGFHWDLVRKTVAIPEKKRIKHHSRLTHFITKCQNHQVLRKDVETINGALAHLSFVHQRGRSRLPSLFHWLTTFPNEFTPRWPPPSVLADLNWWLNTLTETNMYRLLTTPTTPASLDIWVDASTSWGVGILIDRRWDAWRVQDGWDIEGRDIMWLEAIALEFVIGVIADLGYRDLLLLIRSDNTGVIGAFRKGRSRNFHVNFSIRRTEAILDTAGLSFTSSYVESAENLADPISRGILPGHETRIASHFCPSSDVARYFLHV